MPKCTGKKCICSWFWLTNNGTSNFYHTGFDCAVTKVSKHARKIGKPRRPNFTGSRTAVIAGKPAIKGPKSRKSIVLLF